MKQKNLIMLGVAMACGLVAAIAVAQLTAGSGRSGPEMGRVLVAKKDIPVGTKIDEKELDNWVAVAEMPKELVPADAVVEIDSVKNKEVNRTLRRGNPIAISDLGNGSQIVLPDGCKQITIKSTVVDAVGGFVMPGSKVDILYMQRLPNGKSRSKFIMRDMLVLAVNQVDRRDEKTGRVIPQVESVSLAVTDQQAGLLAHAEESGRLKLVLRSPNQVDPKDQSGNGWMENPFDDAIPVSPVPTEGSDSKLATVVYAKKPIPVNTLVNKDNMADLFGTLEVKTAPDGVLTTLDDLRGMYVVRQLEPGQNLLKICLGKDAVAVAEPVEGKPTPAPMVVIQPKPRLPRFEQQIQAGGQTKRVFYVEIAKDRWKRFDSEKEADEYVPESPAKSDSKSEENKPTGESKPQVGS